MKILVDENIPRMTVSALRALGHDVRDLRGSSEQGLSDPDLWEIARAESRLLVTTDKGFAEYRSFEHSGILIIRLRQPNRKKIHDRVMMAMNAFSETEWQSALVVMRDSTVIRSEAQ
jgi:predicted nuclease of predicted toxin-antitoxin system